MRVLCVVLAGFVLCACVTPKAKPITEKSTHLSVNEATQVVMNLAGNCWINSSEETKSTTLFKVAISSPHELNTYVRVLGREISGSSSPFINIHIYEADDGSNISVSRDSERLTKYGIDESLLEFWLNGSKEC